MFENVQCLNQKEVFWNTSNREFECGLMSTRTLDLESGIYYTIPPKQEKLVF